MGPYAVITRLDDRASRVAVPEHRYIARSADGDRTVLLSTPLEGTDPQAFLAEAELSRYLLGPWASPATECAEPGEAPWHARPYVPALPLPTALAVHRAPLPERTVRAVGVALIETLLIGHGQNLTHAGVSPAAVLLAADGPRLTCFGAVRAAAPDGTPRAGLPGLDQGSLPPEQAGGGKPRPLGDIYALGATLAYAATGHTRPEDDALPPSLRTIVLRCLSQDPAARPMPRELLDLLASHPEAPEAPHPTVPHERTVLDSQPGTAGRAAPLLGPGWLPARVIAAMAHQASAVLAAELPAAARAHPAAPPPTPGPAGPVPAPPGPGAATLPASAAPGAPRPAHAAPDRASVVPPHQGAGAPLRTPTLPQAPTPSPQSPEQAGPQPPRQAGAHRPFPAPGRG